MCEKPKRTLIKICGLTTEQDVVYANTFLPDFAGFVLFCPKSRRNLDLPAAAALRRKLSPRIKSVAVVVSPSVQQVREIESQDLIISRSTALCRKRFMRQSICRCSGQCRRMI